MVSASISTVIQCTDRDAPYVLDGLLYNESDLALEEHFADTHGLSSAFTALTRRKTMVPWLR